MVFSGDLQFYFVTACLTHSPDILDFIRLAFLKKKIIAYTTNLNQRRKLCVMEEITNPEFEKSILPWIGRTMKAIDYFINDHFVSKGLQLTKAQMILLKVLSSSGVMNQNNLAFITNRDKTSLTRLITTMEKKELVSRSVDSNDKRIRLVSITKKGEEMFKSAIPILKEVIGKAQQGIEPKDLETAIEVIKQIGKNINIDELTTPLNK